MPEGLYLGKVFDPATQQSGEEFRLRPADLTTHGIVIGMTGSGKTGLSVVLIEEALQAGIPVIVIDPKGDMGNLALAFPELTAAEFAPWVDLDAATREGQTREQAAEAAATLWREGLEGWGLSGEDISRYAASREVRIITPGSTSGVPLNLIESLEPPTEGLDDEEFHDQIDAVVTALLGLLGISADPIESLDYIFLFNLIDNAWRQREALSLEALIGSVANPPIDKLGALPLDTVYPQASRTKLMLALNNLLASPPLAAWRTGEPVDIEAWLRTPDGRPRLSIVYTAHLEEEQRIFVTALILNKLVSWIRSQPGASDLRALLYMDEIFGYFPPTANPPTKKPLLTLLKQARAYGLGVLLSTQNPVDLDYRGLANMGFWAIGRLQTSQDQNRVKTGIEAALADSALGSDFEDLIAGVQKRVFLVHDIHRKGPELVQSRFAMSYLRGPLTRSEIELLTPDSPAATQVATATPVSEVRTAGLASIAPPLPSPLRAYYVDRDGGDTARPFLFVKAAVRYKTAPQVSDQATRTLAFRLDPDLPAAESFAGVPMEMDEAELAEEPPRDVSYTDLPAYVSATGLRGLERALKSRLDDQMAIEVIYDPVTRQTARPGEAAEDFALRLGRIPSQESKRKALESRLANRRAALGAKKDEVKSRGFEKWASIGTSILSNISIFTGRKRTVTGVGGVLSKQRMESQAKSRTEALEAEIARLEEQLAELEYVDSSRFETRTIKPAATDVEILRYDMVWLT